MNDESHYFTRAESWVVDKAEQESRARRIAWAVAGVLAGIAALEAIAIAVMMPLKTTEAVMVLVDRQTGFVQTIDPKSPRLLTADDALTQSLLAQYVTAREGYDRAIVSQNYQRVGLWSNGSARASYLALMPASNPRSPINIYRGGAGLSVDVKSVSRLGPGTALVRFDTRRTEQDGRMGSPQAWASVVRYNFSNASMQFADRLINPLGFQVTSYRRDAEVVQKTVPASEAATVTSSTRSDGLVPAAGAQPPYDIGEDEEE